MTNQDIEKFTKLLSDEEIRIRSELETVAVKDPAVIDGYKPKPAEHGEETRDEDLANEVTESNTNSVLEHELESRLNAVHKAQEKLKNGSYGLCETCGVEIPHERLEALPAAALCVLHAE
jgi:DnaK suppressor protein